MSAWFPPPTRVDTVHVIVSAASSTSDMPVGVSSGDSTGEGAAPPVTQESSPFAQSVAAGHAAPVPVGALVSVQVRLAATSQAAVQALHVPAHAVPAEPATAIDTLACGQYASWSVACV